MASGSSNASLLRARPPRPPANSSKPLQATSRLTPTTSATSATGTASQLNSTASNLSIFLRNLRLLDLDLRPDWPHINPSTFSARDAAQGQKKRIQCVEWALYQLFCLWDPDEARNKLQPFFPPLDQVQSLNLRAALLRSLEHAKKNGVLGRDVLIRKTMLDECKGERIEEVLAVFSSAVLKKLVAEQQLNQPDYPALAQTLALENRGYSGQTTDLSLLSLAHKASLSRHLRHKDAARARFSDFSQVLDLKERTLARRREQTKALEAQEREDGALDTITDDIKRDIWRTVRNNWSGNERWMETLLSGDVHSRKDGLLSTPFDKVWRRVHAGRLTELEDQTGGLLQQLDRRVKAQKERLENWRAFRAEISGTASADTPKREAQLSTRHTGIDLGFGAHESLHLGRLSPRKLPRGRPGELTAEYSDIINALQQELADVGKPCARTRFDNDDDEPDLTLAIRSPPSVTISPAQPAPPAFGSMPTPTEEPEEHGYEDLVSRTRRSMAGFEAAKKRAQLERRRSQRQSSRPIPPSGHRRDGSSYFPAVDEEMGDTTLLLAEELMANEQDDYEAIFKSRPKIKTSPVGSPVKAWEG
ncbi:HAUS augmin-like complex subunit 6 N-terminus-domain-containing protein [Coniochaeta hoffmannii]|uniref:HAUS augmin-like complex subunit 6 N-terminus-domain-containing protein n=1 Tax=Coniochaeta hoffmannii TaxID=91930 RepID=A0AA38RHA0_9PEZI|nr:HAUS augmin-like complex subunit 6 N-terminus-domain-containing protein [Coniochaeta hoffmannii]